MKKNLTIAKLMMLVVMAILPFSMNAQEGKKKSRPAEKYLYLQVDGGLSINHGDLANYQGGIWNDFNHWKKTFPDWNAHFGIGYQLGKVVGLNLKGGYGILSGHKHGVTPTSDVKQLLVLNNTENLAENSPVFTDLGFTGTNYIEGNLNLTFNLFNMFNYNPRRVINLVPHVGIGGVFYKAGIVNQLNGEEVDHEVSPARTKRDITFSVPAGMEFTFNVAPKFDIFIDYTYNFTGSDKLDQVAKIKADEDKHVINDKDMYSQLNLGLRLKFNNPCDIEKMARDSKKITYRVNPDPLVADEDGNVCFDVIVSIPGEYFEKQAVMNLKPYLEYKGGQIELNPETITFIGESVKTDEKDVFQVNYKEGGEFTRHYCLPYQPEMENCELKGDPMFYVYDGKIYPTQDEIVKNTYFTQGSTVKLADGVIAPDCPKVTNVQESVNGDVVTWTWTADSRISAFDIIVTKDGRQIKKEKITATTYSYTMTEDGKYNIEITSDCKYSTSSTENGGEGVNYAAQIIKPDFIYYFDYNKSDIPGNNKNVKDRNTTARKLAKELLTNANDVKNVRIEGFASPENGVGNNNQLSKDRAEAASKDIKAQLKKNANNFEFIDKGNGSDVETFLKLVEESNIEAKNIILNRVKNASNKEKEVQELKLVYPELERDILPLIRRAEVYIIK